jgi:cytochrome b subunit of formate dehydrogenase
MTKNVGRTDSIIRIVAGILLLVLGFFLEISAGWAWALMILGALLLITGIIRFCPVYALLKTNTLNK